MDEKAILIRILPYHRADPGFTLGCCAFHSAGDGETGRRYLHAVCHQRLSGDRQQHRRIGGFYRPGSSKEQGQTVCGDPRSAAVLCCDGRHGRGDQYCGVYTIGPLLGFGLGADACVGVALVGMGMNLGFSGGAFVASTTGTAHTTIGLPMFSGFGFRLALSGTLWVLGSLFLIRYIKQVRNDPTKSAVYGVEEAVREAGDVTMPELTRPSESLF